MRKIFSPDSKIMRAMGRFGDLILLNFFFLLCCVPVVTIGAAHTALYAVCFRFGTDREQGTVKSFFQAFRANFRQGALVWLIIAFCGVAAALNTYVFYLMPGDIRYGFILFALLFVLVLFIFSYAFPLVSQFDNSTYSTLKNALVLSLGYLPRTVLMVTLNLLPWGLLLMDIITFFQAGLVWVGLYFAAAAYLNARLLRKVFAPYLPEDEDAQEEDFL